MSSHQRCFFCSKESSKLKLVNEGNGVGGGRGCETGENDYIFTHILQAQDYRLLVKKNTRMKREQDGAMHHNCVIVCSMIVPTNDWKGRSTFQSQPFMSIHTK